MTRPQLVSVEDKGLGNTAYLLDLGDGRALTVDASRDLRGLNASAANQGLRVVYAADTHLHADFLSGACQLAATLDAAVLAPGAGNRSFDHIGLHDGDEVDLGGLRLRALGTPGHTDDHLAYLLLDGDRPTGVFTGGSLLVGAAARTDLVDPDRTEELARAQYRSMQRLLDLPDKVEVWPTHGSGSFCAATAAGSRTSTIGAERLTNPLLQAPNEDTFVFRLMGSLGSFPPYFLRLGEMNRRGPAVLPTTLEVRSTGRVVQQRASDWAVSIPLRPAFVSWLGWLAPHDRPLIVLREADQDLEEVLWQAAKIGYGNLIGELAGGIGSWIDAGLPTESVPLSTAEAAEDVRVLDVRQTSEFRAGHVPGAMHIELGALEARLDALSTPLGDIPTVVMCGHGERAMGAASLLTRAGLTHVRVLEGGPDDWVAANGQAPETGT